MLISGFNQAVDIFNSGYNKATFKLLREGVSETFYRPIIEKEQKFPYSFLAISSSVFGKSVSYIAELGRAAFDNDKVEIDENTIRLDITADTDEEVVLLDIIGLRFYKLSKGAYNHLLFLDQLRDLDNARRGKKADKEELDAFREYWDKQIQQRV